MIPNASASPAPTPGGAQTPSGNPAIEQFRKALGVDPSQPAPESKVIEAALGNLGPQVKRMAETICQQANPGAKYDGNPDPNQAGGTDAPAPSGDPSGSAPSAQPGAGTPGKLGASAIFGRPSAGDQGEPDEDDEEDETAMPRSSSIFGRR